MGGRRNRGLGVARPLWATPARMAATIVLGTSAAVGLAVASTAAPATLPTSTSCVSSGSWPEYLGDPRHNPAPARR